MKVIFLLILGIVVLTGVLLAGLSCAARPPQAGLQDGRLRPCPPKPNCVCSEEKGTKAWVEPLAFQDSPTRAWQRLRSVVEAQGGSIQRQTDGYVLATFTTRLFRFVDDVEFRLAAEEKLIHVRSASRVGYSDLGLNRKRVEELRDRFNQSANDPGPGSPGLGGGGSG